MARVLIEADGNPTRFYRIVTDAVVIGRSDTADLVLPDAGVSRKHAVIERRGDGWHIRDNGSANGTVVNGVAAPESPFGPGDVAVIGKFSIRIELDEAEELAEYTDPSAGGGRDELTSPGMPVPDFPRRDDAQMPPLSPEAEPTDVAAKAVATPAAPHLLSTDGVRFDLSGKVMPFTSAIPVTGVLPFFSAGEVRALAGGGWEVRRGSFLTPIQVNGKPVTVHRLADGDEILVGSSRFTYRG